MLITLPTDKTVSEAETAPQAAVQGKLFGVRPVHQVRETMQVARDVEATNVKIVKEASASL